MLNYDGGNPNICYAIGDAFSVHIVAESNRQPSAGVFEQLSSIAKDATTDGVLMYDGTNSVVMIDPSTNPTLTDAAGGSWPGMNAYSMALLIGNSVYLRKAGTTDRISVSGVQVDS